MRTRIAALVAAMLAGVTLAGCVVTPPAPTPHLAYADELEEHWEDVPDDLADDATIMMTFTDLPDAADAAAWDAMLARELEAGDALMAAGVGYLDGNGSDGVVYDVFFVGSDHEAMWAIVEPVYADAPIAWSSVMMWASAEDMEPTVELTR